MGYVSDQVTIVDGMSRTHHVMVNGRRVASRKVGRGFSDDQLTWAHSDGRGTVEFESNGRGEVTSQVAYFPSGELWYAGASGTRNRPQFRFQGNELEASTGFYAFGKRHYEPRSGQWLSADPALPEYFTSSLSGGMANPRSLGLYVYAWNNPIAYIAADGRCVGSKRGCEVAHLALQTSGMLPGVGVGAIADGLDVALYLVEGNHGEAAISAAAFIPGAGQGVTAARWEKRGYDAVEATVRNSTKYGDEAAALVKGQDRILPATKGQPRNPDGAFAKGGPGETAGAARGREAHQTYSQLMAKDHDVNVTLSSGRRPDAVNWQTREVREVKPGSKKGNARGHRQVESYRKELEEITGQTWVAHVDAYTP